MSYFCNGDVKSIRNGLSNFLIPAIHRIAAIMKSMVIWSHLFMTNPNAMPAAGACSVLVIAMKKVEVPTAIAPNAISKVC